MAILHDSERRAALHQAKAQVRELERPEREARKIAAAQARRRREKALDGWKEQRQPREHDPGFLAFLRSLPCIAGLMEDGGCSGAVQAAHTRFSDATHDRRNSGMQAKPSDRHATPLCAGHHLHDQHTGSEIKFWARLGIDPGDLSAALHRAYQAGEDGLAVLRRFTPTREA